MWSWIRAYKIYIIKSNQIVGQNKDCTCTIPFLAWQYGVEVVEDMIARTTMNVVKLTMILVGLLLLSAMGKSENVSKRLRIMCLYRSNEWNTKIVSNNNYLDSPAAKLILCSLIPIDKSGKWKTNNIKYWHYLHRNGAARTGLDLQLTEHEFRSMEMDRFWMESDSGNTFYHLFTRIRIQILMFSDTNTK
jgi:hypothetical protein